MMAKVAKNSNSMSLSHNQVEIFSESIMKDYRENHQRMMDSVKSYMNGEISYDEQKAIDSECEIIKKTLLNVIHNLQHTLSMER